MEDFCQLEGRLTQDKYRGSYERCAKVVAKYSAQEMLDQTELFLRIVFSFAVGNSDMHLKNFSLIEDAYGSGRYVLSEAYDMLPVNVILPEDQDQFALTMNGKKRNLRKKDFLVFAQSIGLPEKSAEKLIKKIASMESKYVALCKESLLPDAMKEAFEQLLVERLAVLK
jgi:serine/threonine-protein kinase HipA